MLYISLSAVLIKKVNNLKKCDWNISKRGSNGSSGLIDYADS